MRRYSYFLLALFLIGAGAMGWLYYKSFDEGRKTNPKYLITAVVQTGEDKGKIPSAILAQMMGLSGDHPQNIFLFDGSNAEEKIQACPRVKEVQVKCVKPSIVVVNYTLKKPIALVSDFKNRALSEEGELIPYWEELKLPTVVLGESKEYLPYLMQLLQVFPEPDTEIDFSRLERGYAEKEIVVTLHLQPPLYLRFNPENLPEALENYKILVGHLEPQGIIPQTIDLRSSKLAFITELEERK